MEMTDVQQNWIIAVRQDGVDIALNRGTSQAAVIFPWFKAPEELRPIMDVVKGMGFEVVTETGNIPGYEMPGVDTVDFDYMIVGAK